MNPYDDEPTYRGRSRSSRHGREDEYPGGYDDHSGYSEPTTRSVSGSAGRASVGRASVGRASVSGSAPVPATSPAEPVYGAPYGEAAYGGSGYGGSGYGDSEPTYGAPYGEAEYGSSRYGGEPVSPPRGSAPVSPPRGSAPVSPSGGTPVSPSGGAPVSPGRGVGRAQVRPVSPSTPPGAGGGGYGPGGRGPGGPGGRPPVPGAPGGEGPGRDPSDPGGRRPFGGFGLSADRLRRGFRSGPGGRRGGPGGTNGRRKLFKKARTRNILIIAIALFVILSGGGFVGFTLYADGIKLADQISLPETTTLYYSDGPELARLGQTTRYVVPYENMSPYVIESLIASEDETFWTNEGVQFSAIFRAAWNNVTGGDQQGASTITQQYARVAFDLEGATYNRKIREAVLAWKMSDQLRKEDIIANYLNVVPFGRMTYGAEAAAQAFFKKSIKMDAPEGQRITLSEAMALVAMVKQPEADYDDPDTYPGYDPTRGEEGSVRRQNAERNAHLRWDYVKEQLNKLSGSDHQRFPLTAEELAALEFPVNWVPEAQYTNDQLKQPVGLIVNHVLDELTHTPGSYFANTSWESIRNGGFQIYTTIDSRAQAAAVNAADETVAGSEMNGQPDTMQAALVAVQPGTGRVLAYYGGHDGTDVDYAGIYQDEDGSYAGFGGHPPGSSMKTYVVGAAMRAGYSLNSYWQWTEHDQAARTEANGNRIRNASQCSPDWDAGERKAKSGLCSMLDSTIASLNIPFYEITMSLGANAVLQTALDAGVEHIWNDDRTRNDLLTLQGGATEAVTNGGIGLEVGIGQYPITVVDHANGMATFASGGLRAQAHFVTAVKKNDVLRYGETLPNPDAGRIFNQAQSDLVNYALHQVAPGININGFEAATKTGTWEYNQQADQNAHAWNVGYTTALAAAVWVGPKHDEMALHEADGTMLWGSGPPRRIWTKFMTDATVAMGLDGQKKFNAPNFNVGIEVPPMAHPSPTPSAAPTTNPTRTTNPPRNTTTPPRNTTTPPRNTTTPPATTDDPDE